MATVFVHHRVADYDKWRPVFDEAVKSDIGRDRVWRGVDAPNVVIVANEFTSRQAAEAAMKNPALAESMGRGGVIQSSVRINIVGEVASATR